MTRSPGRNRRDQQRSLRQAPLAGRRIFCRFRRSRHNSSHRAQAPRNLIARDVALYRTSRIRKTVRYPRVPRRCHESPGQIRHSRYFLRPSAVHRAGPAAWLSAQACRHLQLVAPLRIDCCPFPLHRKYATLANESLLPGQFRRQDVTQRMTMLVLSTQPGPPGSHCSRSTARGRNARPSAVTRSNRSR